MKRRLRRVIQGLFGDWKLQKRHQVLHTALKRMDLPVEINYVRVYLRNATQDKGECKRFEQFYQGIEESLRGTKKEWKQYLS
jgi:hypothetical protein